MLPLFGKRKRQKACPSHIICSPLHPCLPALSSISSFWSGVKTTTCWLMSSLACQRMGSEPRWQRTWCGSCGFKAGSGMNTGPSQVAWLLAPVSGCGGANGSGSIDSKASTQGTVLPARGKAALRTKTPDSWTACSPCLPHYLNLIFPVKVTCKAVGSPTWIWMGS